MPGSSKYIGPITPGNVNLVTGLSNALPNSVSLDPLSNLYGSGCVPSGCLPVPGAWMPPWSVTSKAGGVTYVMIIEDAVASYNSNEGFLDGSETVRDNQSGSLTIFSEYINDPDSYPNAFDIIAGFPLTGYSSCKALRDEVYSLHYSIEVLPGWDDFEYTYTPIGGSSEVTRDGCPDDLYDLYGETQTSSSGIIYISGDAVQCTWETIL